MKIIIGTQNQIKTGAVRETIPGYDFLKDATIEKIDVPSGVAGQPQSLEETVRGAKNRAAGAFKNRQGDLGIGLEDGLMAFPWSLTGFLNICVCAVYDGKRYYLGTSAGFEYPPGAIELVAKGMDINQAFYKMGLTDNPQIGSAQGAIAILTHGRWNRKDTVKQALIAALIPLENNYHGA